MDKKLIIATVVFFIILAAAIALVIIPAPKVAQAPTTTQTTASSSPISDLIVVDSPKPGDTISSTTSITITGKARGSWYFEASAPYQLTNASGTVLVQGHIEAQGDWMTTDFVPFSASITFPVQPTGSKGILILKNDNPSGDSSKDRKLEIPVAFK